MVRLDADLFVGKLEDAEFEYVMVDERTQLRWALIEVDQFLRTRGYKAYSPKCLEERILGSWS